MRYLKWGLAATTAAVLTACGGGGDGNQAPKVQYSTLVSFGDSLSDVGSYKVGTVKALGGGQYTVNGTGQNWIERVAGQLKVAAPCAAQTGLDGLAAQGFSVPVTNNAGCTAYAQGGARVTNPVGPGNKLLGGGNAILGQLTVPLLTQMQNHLAASAGAYKGTEAVFIMAGGNDVFINLATFDATVKGGGNPQTAGQAAAVAMGTAGAELAGYIKALVVGKGAKYVTVVNLPDVSKTPFAYSFDAQTQGFINTLTTTFNDQLKAGLAGVDVLYVDAYTVSRDQAINPQQYGISNGTTPACILDAVLPNGTPNPQPKNPLNSSLVCSASNVIAGDISKYQFADGVHPTPFGYQLLAQLVTSEMIKKGWL